MIFRKIVVALLALAACVPIVADDVDSERDHVVVTLDNGTTVEGYIRQYWFDGKMFKKSNRKFKMSSTPSGSDIKEYTADEVKSVEFVKRGEHGAYYPRLESHDVANPSTFKPGKVKRQFVYAEAQTGIGAIYWWNGYDSQRMQLGQIGVSTIYGVRFEGDDVIIPFMTGNVISLNAMRIVYKKKDPAFVDYVDRVVLKGGKRLWDAIARNPALFLDICAGYERLDIRK